MQTETITIEDGTTEQEFSYSVERWIQCEHCGYTWESHSDLERPSCSSCNNRTDRNYILRYHFFSKMTCWIEENPNEEMIYDRLHHTFDRDDLTLYIEDRDSFYVGAANVDSVIPVIYTGHPRDSNKPSFRVDDDKFIKPFRFETIEELVSMWEDGELDGVLPGLPRQSTKLEELSQSSEQWPSRPPKNVEPYAQSLRNYARKLEVLTENGWELVESDGEHLWFEKTEEK